MDWLSENIIQIISILFGTGGVGYAIVSKILDRRKYEQEVRQAKVDADIHTDDFWKKRYDILSEELKNKDKWWKERYDNLCAEYQNERKLSNEIIKNFRMELNEIREDYERQHDIDNQKYDALMKQYRDYQDEVERKNREQIARICQLEKLVSEYEERLKQQ